MKAIIIAAGLGSRLRPLTSKIPKILVKIGNKSILDHQIAIFKNLFINKVSMIVGYKRKVLKKKGITFYFNKNFKKNNILFSLFYAKKELNNKCIISYSDIIFKKNIVNKLMKSKDDITLLVDVDWKKNYIGRTLHPLSEAEKVTFNSNKTLTDIGKNVKISKTNGEFVGMLKLSKKGCDIFKKYFKEINNKFKNKEFFNANKIEKAYITDFLKYLMFKKIKIRCCVIKNNWMEIDTIQDYKRAQLFYEK
jgi:L-glutamine-phosphate cytidylyltransferase